MTQWFFRDPATLFILRGHMASEKRRFSRICYKVRAKLQVDGSEYVLDQIANLSVGGCLLQIGEDVPEGAACTLIILLDRMAPGVDVKGEILRSDGGEVVVQFTTIDPESLFHMQNIIRYNAENPDAIEEEISEHPGLI